MKFSVITISYNCCKTIEKTIKSVIMQKVKYYEYIIIDGASTDGTLDIIDKYKDKLSYFVSEPDEGIYHAMNKGIEASTGDYLIFLNADDYFDGDDVLERIATYCSGNNIVIGREYCGSRLSEVVNLDKKISKYYGIFYPHQATFVPKKIFDTIGLYSLEYLVSADFEWICRAIYNGVEINWIDVIVSHYTIGGISSRINCDIDEYNISFKYMFLSGEQSLIPNLQKYSCEKAKNTIFREMIQDINLSEKIKSELKKIVNVHDGVTLWGAGYLSKLYIEMFNRIDIPIKYIIDKRSKEDVFSEIPLVKYKKELVYHLFVTSEVYNDEITSFLEKEGFRNEVDFFSQKALRDKMIKMIDNYKSTKEFEKKTGLKLFS